jgi:hypothetical protein
MWKTARNYTGSLFAADVAYEPAWFPLFRLVCYVKSQPYADSVFAYNSLNHFVLTTAPSYEVRNDHDSVTSSYSALQRYFAISYLSRRHGADTGYLCAPEQVFTLVDSLVLRMLLMQRVPLEHVRIAEESEPHFQVGETVEVILNERNRTPRRGRVQHVVRHHKQKRFFYYLESDGRPVKKRYFTADLRRAELAHAPEPAQPSWSIPRG